VRDVTRSNRQNSGSGSDCGGRLGPYTKTGKPDLRNFKVDYYSLQTNDLLILASDGVHDNLDPQMLGKRPRDLQLDAKSWAELPPKEGYEAKTCFQETKLAELINGCSRTPKDVCDTIAQYCDRVTAAGREFMESHPTLELPEDYVTFPGKMDHTSVVCIKVESTGLATAQLLRHAFRKKETFTGQITKEDLDRITFRPNSQRVPF
jgi:hypothetical protein